MGRLRIGLQDHQTMQITQPSVADVNASVSVWQAVLIASIPAVIGIVGVVVTVIVNTRQNKNLWEKQYTAQREQREHELDADREKFLRPERRSLYWSAIAAARQLLR